MTIGEYITSKFQSFGYQISEADFFDMDLNPDDEATSDNNELIRYKIVKFIPQLLLRANVSESGFSFSFDKEAIKDYYSIACKEFGIKDELSNKPKVEFL